MLPNSDLLMKIGTPKALNHFLSYTLPKGMKRLHLRTELFPVKEKKCLRTRYCDISDPPKTPPGTPMRPPVCLVHSGDLNQTTDQKKF